MKHVKRFIRLCGALMIAAKNNCVIWWRGTSQFFRSLGQWSAVVIGCLLLLWVFPSGKTALVVLCGVLALLGFCGGYLFATMDNGDGYDDDNSEEHCREVQP